MPNQEQQREDKLIEAAHKSLAEHDITGLNSNEYHDCLQMALNFAKSPEVAAYHRTPVEVEAIRAEWVRRSDYIKTKGIDTEEIWKLFAPHLQPSGESEAKLLGALKQIESIVDNQNSSHEDIWRIANGAIQDHTEFLKHKQLPTSRVENNTK